MQASSGSFLRGLASALRASTRTGQQQVERQLSSLACSTSSSSSGSMLAASWPAGWTPSTAAVGAQAPFALRAAPRMPCVASSWRSGWLPQHATPAPAAPAGVSLLPQPHAPALQQLQQRRGFLLMPRRIKYRKAFKGIGFNETIVPNHRQLAFGQYGIRAMEHARLPARTIEAVRRTLRRTVKKTTMIWIRMTPNVPVSKKPAETRMGKGKGATEYYAAVVRPGQVMFEMDRVPRKVALDAVKAVAPKLPIRVGFLEWN